MPKKKTYERPDARKVVEKAMGAPLLWSDYDSMQVNEKKLAAQQAKQILISPVFMSEFNRLLDVWVKHAACKTENYDQVRDMRMCINAIVLLRERFEEIAAFIDKKQTPVEDAFSGI